MTKSLFESYKNSLAGFDRFNKLVINMPRHEFRSMSIQFVISLAKVLLEARKYIDNDEKLTVIKLYYFIQLSLMKNLEIKKDVDPFILNLFDFSRVLEQDMTEYYRDHDGDARNFRHLVEIMRLWGLIDADEELSNRINYETCEEFCKLKLNEIEGLRSRMVGMDIEDNAFFVSLKNIAEKIRNKTIFSYKPAAAILRYIKEMNRPVSKFEISNFLAVITTECTSEESLFDNAINLGKQLPINTTEHKSWFFKYMNWYDENGKEFNYEQSQAPTFKFNSFIIFMKSLDLISENRDESLNLTDYAKNILNEAIPPEIVELERYIKIAEESYSDRDLANLIIRNIKPSLLSYASQNDAFIKAMNKRSLEHPVFIRGKKVRNRLIAELSKVRANYTCQVGGTPTFRDNKGNIYVEAHHIIEFNGEDGPDIVENILIINPYYHDLIHHAGKEDLQDFYDTLRKKNIVTIDMFKNMIDTYHCLGEEHIKALYNKRLITNVEYQDLVCYIKTKATAS